MAQSTFYLDENSKKKPLELKMVDRLKNIEEQIKKDNMCQKKSQLNTQISANKLNIKDKTYLGHLATNRYSENFYGSRNIIYSKPLEYFDYMIS